MLKTLRMRQMRGAVSELGEMMDRVNRILSLSIEAFAKDDESHLDEVSSLEDEIDRTEKELQNKHVERLSANECSPESGMLYSDIVTGLERVADHARNIAFAFKEAEMAQNRTARQVSAKF